MLDGNSEIVSLHMWTLEVQRSAMMLMVLDMQEQYTVGLIAAVLAKPPTTMESIAKISYELRLSTVGAIYFPL